MNNKKLLAIAGVVTMVLIATSCASQVDTYFEKTSIEKAFATFSENELKEFISDVGSISIKNYTYGRGYSPVHAAVINKIYPNAIDFAYSTGANIDQQDDDDRTPLHHAIDANQPETAQRLLLLGSRTDIVNKAGYDAKNFCKVVLKSEPNHATCQLVIQNTLK